METALVLAGMDTTGLTEAEIQELQIAFKENFDQSKSGFNFKPQRIKINKDAQVFVDSFAKSLEELSGVMLHKQQIRALWQKNDPIPLCSSLDCVTGKDRNGTARPCSSCPHNAWGSASENGEERKGKACKEMRRIYLLPKGSLAPVLVTLPPTSISNWDNYCSARVTQGIPDLAAEVRLTLIKQSAYGQNFAVVVPKMGDKVAPKQMLELNRLRKQYIETWQNAAIEEDEYMGESEAMPGAATLRDDKEPY